MLSISSPLVSIGMPVYNGEEYIEEALDSLLAQTFTDFELIISDNASIDGTQSICQIYAKRDQRIKYILQPQNNGAWSNFQFVLNQAQGVYFMWAASDDIWDKDWILKLKSVLEEFEVGAAFGKLMHIDKNSKPLIHPANSTTFRFCGSPIMRRLHYFVEFERYGKANPIHSLFRITALKDLDLSEYSVDFHVVFDILLETEIISVPTTILYKRVHLFNGAGEEIFTRRSIFRQCSNILLPLNVGFVKGYFLRSKRFELLLLGLFLPIKFIMAYVFYLKAIMLRLRIALSRFLN